MASAIMEVSKNIIKTKFVKYYESRLLPFSNFSEASAVWYLKPDKCSWLED